ncbi:MAG: ABC transporter ATP-binding protein [Spirochaetales bacterium]|nr:ABC transporter ATP-binding protein [Spirochaetales bacterium]
MISLKNVSKTYGKGKTRVEAVKNLKLEVKKGELFGFLGPNGAGKTTTIKMIVGLLKPDNGGIVLNNIDALKQRIKAKSIIGYVPDEPLFYDNMTGYKFLTFIADVYNVELSGRKRIDELAELFELTAALPDPISSYSHGIQQKTALIAAMLHSPEILILDEPIVGLDPKAAFNLKEKMRNYCREGKTVFFSTHVMEVAEHLCDRVGIINRGELIAAAPPGELKNSPGKTNSSLEQIFLEMTNEADIPAG